MEFRRKKENKSIAQNISEFQKKCPETEPIYIKVIREMTGEKRLKTAFELYEIVLNLCRQNILEQNPNISEKKLKACVPLYTDWSTALVADLAGAL